MNTITKFSTLAACAFGAASLLAIPSVAAASDNNDIVVVSQPAMDEWAERTTVELNRALSRGVNARGMPNNAIVQVTFTLDENGRPENLEHYNSEGNYDARSIARRGIMGLRNLDKVPLASADNVQFLANIIFANNKEVHEELANRLEKMEQVRLASSKPDRTYIALGH